MSGEIGKPERETQRRVLTLFQEELGYRYLGDWTDRQGNSNIEQVLLTAYLRDKAGYSDAHIRGAIQKLTTEATNKSRGLYDNNKAVYGLLRYGVGVKVEAGKSEDTVRLINWDDPAANDFAIAEEVTIRGGSNRRPDLVLYVNGLALAVIELKNSRVSVGEGIRQMLSNQKPDFNERFFVTAQYLFAGNDTEGLRYGTILTPEKYFLKWKEDEGDNTRYKLDKYLLKMASKQRLLELVHDFVVFDDGIKKVPRVHQYVGIKRAQEYARRKEGGIIWHTQGSGKSIVMVLFAKWLLENRPEARVVVITDRDELDKQIEGVFSDSGEQIERSSSGKELMGQLAQAKPRLLCSLVHKFGLRDGKKRSDKEFEEYLKGLEATPSPVVGEVYCFVDECHRTQSGRLHKLMKALMPGAVFVGFTGTPLLKKDRKTSREVFGGYIHTYKFAEAKDDGVVLDLVYEARDIDQRLSSPERIDQWFDAKTRGLNEWQRDELKTKWGTLQRVLSSKSRMGRVVSDILFDFSVKPRLSSERGNAILVASSIYEACRYYELFQHTPLAGKVGIVTSYDPHVGDVTLEETGAGTQTEKQSIYQTYQELLLHVVADPNKSKTETYEDAVKKQFVEQPAKMKLLVVVNKLLTGFDAPSCTYLYIDKSMQDHGLFQAICRTNRLDGEDKEFGYIVDYKDLFKNVENAIAVYTSELDDPGDGGSPEVLLQDRLTRGREKLDSAVEALHLLCEPVEQPRSELQHIHFFCGNTEIATDLEETAPRRETLYKLTAAFVRAYAAIADEMSEAGYSDDRVEEIARLRKHYLRLRDTIRNAAGEALDLKPYEADMRHLIDTYIEADEARVVSPFGDIGLLDLIVKTGIADAIAARLGGLGGNQAAIAETIENNVRRKIVREQTADPAFYERMSKLLDEVIAARRQKAIEYQEYLRRIADLVQRLDAGKSEDTPASLDTPGKRAIYNHLTASGEWESGEALDLADQVHTVVRRVRPDGWRGVQAKEQVIKAALFGLLQDEDRVESIFDILVAQGEY